MTEDLKSQTIIEADGVVLTTTPRRGRAPGKITFKIGNEALEAGTYEGNILQLGSELQGQEVHFTYTTKTVEKDGVVKEYVNLLSVTPRNAPVGAVLPLGGPQNEEVGVGQPDNISGASTGLVGPVRAYPEPSAPLNELKLLEQNFALAVRQRELLEDFIKRRFKEGVHYSDGKMFKTNRPCLLQPGAQLLLYAHGYRIEFKIISGPLSPPSNPETQYTIVAEAIVRNRFGHIVATALGSCGSHVYSNMESRYKLRNNDVEKTHNSCVKMSQKRAMVSVTRQATAASEFFEDDLEEEVGVPADVDSPKVNRFFKKRN